MTGEARLNLLTWEEVLPAAEQAFSVWTHGRELEWAQVAWNHLAAAGLTEYRSETERYRGCIRLLALAQIYLDWCSLADEQSEEDNLSNWAWEFDLGAFRLGQLVGNTVNIEGDDDDELRLAALEALTERERRKVRDAILAGFGGDNGLFLSLWRINHPAPAPKPPKPDKPVAETKQPPFTGTLFPDETPSLFSLDEDDEEPEEEEDVDDEDEDDGEDDWQVMNCLSENKMAAYEWIADGCPSVR